MQHTILRKGCMLGELGGGGGGSGRLRGREGGSHMYTCMKGCICWERDKEGLERDENQG